MAPAARLSVAVTGAAVTCTLGDATLSRRHAHGCDQARVAALARAAIATLARATHARALADRNLADLRRAGEELYLALLPPEIREALRAHAGPLLLELDDVLVTVPWELLFDGEQFLCRRYDVGRQVATGQTVRGAPARTVAPPLRMLVLAADPAGDLPAVHAEGEALCAAMDRHPGVRAHLLANADPDTVRRHLKEFDAVHFAGHAEHRPDCPADSGWHLRGGDFTAADVVALAGGSPLPLIVFANGCRSTQTDAWVGDDPGQVYGLANAFLLAGVRFYVGTQWDVLDGGGQAFGVRFWSALATGLTVGAAMRRAREEVAREQGEDALRWAPYVLYGEPTFAPLAAVALPRDRSELVPRPGALAKRRSMPFKRIPEADLRRAAEQRRAAALKPADAAEAEAARARAVPPAAAAAAAAPVAAPAPSSTMPPPAGPAPASVTLPPPAPGFVTLPPVAAPGYAAPPPVAAPGYAALPPGYSPGVTPGLPYAPMTGSGPTYAPPTGSGPAYPPSSGTGAAYPPASEAGAAYPPAPAPSHRGRTVVAVLAAAVVLVASGVGATLLWRARVAAPRAERRTIALLGVGTGTSLEGGAEAHAARLEGCLLGALARERRFRLVDRARISALKRERGAELARLGSSGAAAAGRELRADYVVYGEVTVVSGRPFFSVFCADPATHQVVFGDNLDGLDSRGCDQLGKRLVERLGEVERRGRSE